MGGSGTEVDPWRLKKPPLTSDYEMYLDERVIEDLHAMLQEHDDWMELGSTDEQKPAKEGTVEARGRSPRNPVSGWYGLKQGLRGRFGTYLPPLLEELGKAEVEHNRRNNSMRAI